MLASTKFQRFIKIGSIIQKWQQNKMRAPKISRFPAKINGYRERMNEIAWNFGKQNGMLVSTNSQSFI